MSHARLLLLVTETLRQVAVAHGGFALVEDINERLPVLDKESMLTAMRCDHA